MLKKGEINMIKKFLKEGMSKSAIARKLGISRETVRKYALKPDGYVPVIVKAPIETVVDKYLPHISDMLLTAKENNVYIPITVIYEDIKQLGYAGTLRWLQQVINKHELRGRIEFDAKELDDHVLIKSGWVPTYQFANVIDDHLMEITHVVRGAEWIPSLPKNILLYKAFHFRRLICKIQVLHLHLR